MGVDGSRRRSRRMNKDSQRGRGWSYWSRTVAYEVKATKGNACHRFGFANWWFEFDLHGWARDVFSSCWYLTSYFRNFLVEYTSNFEECCPAHRVLKQHNT